MAYTVTLIILQEADKLGSDYFPLPEVLGIKKETLDFGSRVKRSRNESRSN
jgi:hypothetical protein